MILLWILCSIFGMALLGLIGVAGFFLYDSILTMNCKKKIKNGKIINQIENIFQGGKFVKKDKFGYLKIGKKGTKIKLKTDGKTVTIYTATETTLFTIQKSEEGLHYIIGSEQDLKLFMPYLETLYDNMIAKYNEEFNKEDGYLNGVIRDFEERFHHQIHEHEKHGLKEGNYRLDYVKSFGDYTFRLYINNVPVWYARYNENGCVSTESEEFNDRYFNEEEISYLQEKIQTIKTTIKKKITDGSSQVEKEMDAVYQMIKKNEQTDDETKQQLDNIFQLYHALSKEMKQEKEKEILSLIQNVKTEIKQEKIYLVD